MALPGWLSRGKRIVAQNEESRWSLTDVERRVDALAALLHASQVARAPIGLLADNSPHWIAVDLATQVAGATLIPLPAFFTRAQLAHVIDAGGMESMLCADAAVASALGFSQQVGSDEVLGLFVRPGGAS